MQKIQKITHYTVLVSLLSHFFCCVLPSAASLIGLGASFGLISASVEYFEWFHQHEEAFLAFSASMLLIAGIAQFISWRIDCSKTGCEHGACEPKKKNSTKILIFATCLFLLNLLVHIGHI